MHDRLGWRVTQVGTEVHCFALGTQPLIIGAWIATGIAALAAMQLSVLPIMLPEGQRWVGVVAPGILLLLSSVIARALFRAYRGVRGKQPSPTAILDLTTGAVRDARGQTVGNFLTDRIERRRNWSYRTPGFIGYLVVRGPSSRTRLAQGDRSDLDVLEAQLRDLCQKHAGA